MPTRSSSEPRRHLVRALEADLVGPFTLDPASVETLSIAPTRAYITGFLAPQHAMPDDEAPEDDAIGVGNDEDEADGGPSDQAPKGPRIFPASIGLSVLLPAAPAKPDVVTVTLQYAEYVAVALDDAPPGKKRAPSKGQRFTRVPKAAVSVDVRVDAEALARGVEIAPAIFVEGRLGEAASPGLPPGTRALALFVVNRRPVREDRPFDESCIFQVGLHVRHAGGLVARPNRRDEASEEDDEKVVDLQFRDRSEWAVGHGVSVEAIEERGAIVGARTTWIPCHEVPRVETHAIGEVETSMDALAACADGAALRKKLTPLVDHYGTWIATQRKIAVGAGRDETRREETRDMLMHRADEAKRRIARGIDSLASSDDVREAFRLANRAMAAAARQRSPERYADGVPSWHLFQLAFVLLNLEAVADPASDDRAIVELLFFPTGGGKTEAYLGVIAFALVLRRLRAHGRPDAGLGVAVLLRYTLRLLTLDQLGRAATLVCALERLRQEEPERLGVERFSIGLWVGRSATPNTIEQAVDQIRAYRADRGPSPFPLPSCPWCRTALNPQSITTEPPRKPVRIVVGCLHVDCPFATANDRDGIPVLFVDEQIYRELPCFLVATVDKLAMLPWLGRTAGLFGRVHSRIGKDFFGPMDGEGPTKGATPLPDGLLPPELIVQDELHLIAGPLGTMVGLYETAVEALSTRTVGGARIVPKILASTATARRADRQVRSIFGRSRTSVFPPAGVDDSETFFAGVDKTNPGRLYVGVAAPGQALKKVLIRTYIALLGAAQRVFEDPDVPRDAADAYMSLVGYFNSLRELGGMRRLLEDEIRFQTASDEHERVPVGFVGDHPWVKRRTIKYEPVELTSRETTAAIAQAKRALETAHPSKGQIDVALASNMISVGLDIDRLGLMVIAGQPKTTSEYIQSSSRVGRDKRRPGLVVTVFNHFRPRDRSHYERFGAYHESFYRFVEATSVTPFSTPAIERGLAGVVVTMTRLGDPKLTPALAVTCVDEIRRDALVAIGQIAQKAANEHEGGSADDVALITEQITRIGKNLIDAWQQAVGDGPDGGATCYSSLDGGKAPPLLFTTLDGDAPLATTPRGKFCVGTSMRDVEPSVHLWKKKQRLVGREDDSGR